MGRDAAESNEKDNRTVLVSEKAPRKPEGALRDSVGTLPGEGNGSLEIGLRPRVYAVSRRIVRQKPTLDR